MLGVVYQLQHQCFGAVGFALGIRLADQLLHCIAAIMVCQYGRHMHYAIAKTGQQRYAIHAVHARIWHAPYGSIGPLLQKMCVLNARTVVTPSRYTPRLVLNDGAAVPAIDLQQGVRWGRLRHGLSFGCAKGQPGYKVFLHQKEYQNRWQSSHNRASRNQVPLRHPHAVERFKPAGNRHGMAALD